MNDALRQALDAFYKQQNEQPIQEAPCSLSHIKPRLSDALAVTPRQAQAYEADAKRKGVPTEFAKDGRPIMRSRAHQKAYLKAYGFHNNDGGYGD